MVNKYNNPRLFNTVLTGPGMNHPRNPHVVIGSDTKGFIQGDMMDANAVMETIDQKIDVDNLIDEGKIMSAVQTATERILGQVNLNNYAQFPLSWDMSGGVEELMTSIMVDNNAKPGSTYFNSPVINWSGAPNGETAGLLIVTVLASESNLKAVFLDWYNSSGNRWQQLCAGPVNTDWYRYISENDFRYLSIPESWDASTQDSFVRSIINDSSAISGKKYLAYTEDDFTSEERSEILTGPNDFGATGPGRSLFIEIMDTTGDITESSWYVSERIKFTYIDDDGQVYIGHPMIDYEDEDEHEVFYIQWETLLDFDQKVKLDGMKVKLDGIETGAEVNLNAFSIIRIGNTDIAADSKEDVLEFIPGTNIELVPNVSSDKITINLNPTIVERPAEGDYLYQDYTWGKSSVGAIGICVNNGTSFDDGNARFVPYPFTATTSLVFSTEDAWLTTTSDGASNTDLMIARGAGKYPAAEYCRTYFDGKGYLPSQYELESCSMRLSSLNILRGNFCWASTQYDTDDYHINPDTRAMIVKISYPPQSTWKLKSQASLVIPFVRVAPIEKTLVYASVSSNTLNILPINS